MGLNLLQPMEFIFTELFFSFGLRELILVRQLVYFEFFKFSIIYVTEDKAYFQLQPYLGFTCKH